MVRARERYALGESKGAVSDDLDLDTGNIDLLEQRKQIGIAKTVKIETYNASVGIVDVGYISFMQGKELATQKIVTRSEVVRNLHVLPVDEVSFSIHRITSTKIRTFPA